MKAIFPNYEKLDLSRIADKILNHWATHKIFEKSVSERDKEKPYVFFEGPPSANGLPGIHHVLARTIKDIFPRYKTMKGYRVERKAGWDTHGLPIELGVEKELQITKEDIGKSISIEDYNNACKEAVMRYTHVWNDLTIKMGYWIDTNNPYVTYDSKYMESVWWLLKQIYDKNLLYKGYTVQPYSPKAGTGLSSHELNQPGTYQDITDTTVVAQFLALDETLPNILKDKGKIYFLAWTTTPWTLPSNTALTVGLKIKYVLVKTYNQYTFKSINVILATDLLEKQFNSNFVRVDDEKILKLYNSGDKQIPYYVSDTFLGDVLVGIKYHQLMDYCLPHENAENAFRVISADFVNVEDGTGIVHTAPTFGADDAIAAKQANPEIPPMLVKDKFGNLVPLVDLQGRFRNEVTDFAGQYVKNQYYKDNNAPKKSVDVQIAIKLKIENKAFKVEKYKHSYPNCWRTDKPILYYPLDSWFIKINDIKSEMFKLNHNINWKPKSTGEGRFGNWLSNANDWNLSRSRYWGIPLPIWRTKDGKEEICIGSIEEIKNEIEKAVEAGVMSEPMFDDFIVGDYSNFNYSKVDLHKNIVDDIVLISNNGQPMYRESDLIDVWFDSGSMPYAQWHYPFENSDLINEGKAFPADFIAEGVDQTRGWFYTLHAISSIVFGSVAYKNVISNGLVLDKNGQKMSKRLGNAIDPFKVLKAFGPDATRWYMIANANPWDNLKFDVEGVGEVQRKFFGTLYNTYSFFTLYANIDNFDNSLDQIKYKNRPEIDCWIISELNTLIEKVDSNYSNYEPTKAARNISFFTQEHLSNWYVRLSRRRFWKGKLSQDKISAYQTLFECILTISKLAAPIAPFFMDSLYLDLNQNTAFETNLSVHLSKFPKPNLKLIDKDLQNKMSTAQLISSLVLSLRAKEKIKVRQPLQKIMIPINSDEHKRDLEAVGDLIKHEVNVKEIELLGSTSEIIVKQIKPNFKLLGPRFGRGINELAKLIEGFDSRTIQDFEENGSIEIEINGQSAILEKDDVIISFKDIDGCIVASDRGMTVALDVQITKELRYEGIARELVNRIQNYRKDLGFDVTDKINIFIKNEEKVYNAVNGNLNYIKDETLSEKIEIVSHLDAGIEVRFDDISTKIFIDKIDK